MTPPPSQIASDSDLTDRQYQASLQSDAELLDLYVLGGQTQALLTLLLRFTPMMTSVIRRVVSHAQDSEDAFQATCLVLMQSAKKIRSRRSIAAWLYGVAYRTACRVRSKSRRQATGVDAMELPDKNFSDDPIAQIVRQIELSNLDRELQSLPDVYREPLIEHYILGYTAREIAERMELSSSAVEGRLRRGRQMLRESLAERGASLSVCAVGVAWMRDHQQTAIAGQQLADQFVQSPVFQCPESLSEQDPYLFDLVQGETHMHMASLFKSVGFLGSVAFATLSLSMIAWSMQGRSPSSPGSGQGNSNGVQSVPAPEDPASSAALVESTSPEQSNQKSAVAQSKAKSATSSNTRSGPDVIRFVKPSTPPPSWLKAGQDDQTSAELVRDHLRNRTELDFVEVPLEAAIAKLNEQSPPGVQIVIDRESLENAGRTMDDPVTVRVDSLPLHQGLSLMLNQLGLDYEIHPDMVKVVDASSVETAVRYYDLAHVLPSSAGVSSLMSTVQFVVENPGDEEMSVVGSMLVVRASEHSHRQIEKLLSEVSKLPPENLPANYSQVPPSGGMGGGMGGMGGGFGGMGGGGGGMGGGGMF